MLLRPYIWSYQSYDDRDLWVHGHVMTKVYHATSRLMMEVGGGASRTMKVCGATESISIANSTS